MKELQAETGVTITIVESRDEYTRILNSPGKPLPPFTPSIDEIGWNEEEPLVCFAKEGAVDRYYQYAFRDDRGYLYVGWTRCKEEEYLNFDGVETPDWKEVAGDYTDDDKECPGEREL